MRRKWRIVGGLLAVEAVVCIGMALAVNAGVPSLRGMRVFYVGDTHVEETIEETFQVDGPATLDLENLAGDVTVTGFDGHEVQVTGRADLWGASEEEARGQLKVAMTRQGERLVVRVTRLEDATRVMLFAYHRSSSVHFEINVPRDTYALLTSDGGNLSLSDTTRGAQLRSGYGDVSAARVGGPVTVSSSSGNITLAGLNHAGDLSAETDFGTVKLSDVARTV